MNSIRQIQELNKRELEAGVSPEASWHADYRDTAYINIGGLPFELSEGDIVTIFSQFGEPTYINLKRDKETGKSRGFAFLKYEDQRSTDLAVDNLGGTVIMGRTLRVDHTRYKKRDDEPDDGIDLTVDPQQNEEGSPRKRRRTSESESEEERPMIKEERELAKLVQDHDEDDPMKEFLIQEKKDEIAAALAKLKEGKKSGKSHKHRHHHRSRRLKEEGEESYEKRQSRHWKEDRERRRPRSRDISPIVDSRARPERDAGATNEKFDDYRDRRRSPRRHGDDRRHHETGHEPFNRREESRNGRHYTSRRDY